MMNTRDSEVSALFDGELEEHEVRGAIRAALDSEARRETWQMYGLIGDGLRGEGADVPDLTANIMERIREEPVVLAPRKLIAQRRQHPFLALAASVAGVAVVGWLALADANPQQGGNMSRMAAASPAPSFARLDDNAAIARVAQKSRDTRPMRGEMNEYLLAHLLQAGTFRPGESPRQVRPVVMDTSAERP